MVQREKWHGKSAVRLESDRVSVVVLPERGAKIASLMNAHGYEWLAQPASGALVAARRGDVFPDAEMCGWDEMFPTLKSEGLPDHGEVWAEPWAVLRVDSQSIETEFRGVSRPYLLRRRLELTDAGIVLRYSATATASTTAVMWVAHPQFIAPAGTQLVLPEGPAFVSPSVDGTNGTQLDSLVDPFATLARGEARKLWFRSESQPSIIGLRNAHGDGLTLRWNNAEVPYSSVWLDNACKSREPVVAIEPATGFGADLITAAASGRAMELTSTEWRHWSISVDFSYGGSNGS